MTEPTATRPYYPALDGVRGVAILLVLLLHYFGFINYFFFGWLGVDLFFVLSGFLITDLLLRSLGTVNFLKNFYIRRLLRIFPVYYATIFFCLFVLPLVYTGIEADFYKRNIFWFLFFLQNWLFVFKQPGTNSMLVHLWSLAVEEQFYLIWPLIILLVKNLKSLVWTILSLLIIVVIGRYLFWSFHVQHLAYDTLYTFTRIDGICVGCLLALMLRVSPGFLKKYTHIIVLALAGLNFLMYFANVRASVRLPYLAFIGYTTFAIMFGFLVYEAIIEKSVVINLLFNNRVLKFFGRISYGLYVFHWPIYLVLFPVIQEFMLQRTNITASTAKIVAALAVTMAAVLVSFMSYTYFEIKFLRLKRHFA